MCATGHPKMRRLSENFYWLKLFFFKLQRSIVLSFLRMNAADKCLILSHRIEYMKLVVFCSYNLHIAAMSTSPSSTCRIKSTYKFERQNFRTGRRIAPKFGTHVPIDTLTLTLIVLHKYTHVKPAALPYLRVTAAAVLNKSVELDWN